MCTQRTKEKNFLKYKKGNKGIKFLIPFLGWYKSHPDPEIHDNTPCIFESVTPAWNNQNLTRLAEKIKSPLVFAHVRASTSGALSETNCRSLLNWKKLLLLLF